MTTDPYSRFRNALDALDTADLRRELRTVSGRTGPRATVGGRRLLNLSSNDYLGIGSDEVLCRAFHEVCLGESLDRMGMTASASRLLTGNHPAYAALEHDLSELYGNRPACVFSSGYHANVGICPVLAGRGDLVLSDKLSHASLLDGIRLSGARHMRYRHLDTVHLEDLLRKHRAKHEVALIVSESVFSMDGDVADVARLVELKSRYDALLILDEAHAVGTQGPSGLGMARQEGLDAEVDVLVGTFGKALASFGAFCITEATIHDTLVNRMRPLIFTTALPPAPVVWTRTTLRQAVSMDRERRHLAGLADRTRAAFRKRDIETRGDTQIVPVMVGDNATAERVASRVRDAGFLVFPIRPPTVPAGTARLRLSLTADMRWQDIEALPEVVEQALHEEGMDSA